MTMTGNDDERMNGVLLASADDYTLRLRDGALAVGYRGATVRAGEQVLVAGRPGTKPDGAPVSFMDMQAVLRRFNYCQLLEAATDPLLVYVMNAVGSACALDVDAGYEPEGRDECALSVVFSGDESIDVDYDGLVLTSENPLEARKGKGLKLERQGQIGTISMFNAIAEALVPFTSLFLLGVEEVRLSAGGATLATYTPDPGDGDEYIVTVPDGSPIDEDYDPRGYDALRGTGFDRIDPADATIAVRAAIPELGALLR